MIKGIHKLKRFLNTNTAVAFVVAGALAIGFGSLQIGTAHPIGAKVYRQIIQPFVSAPIANGVNVVTQEGNSVSQNAVQCVTLNNTVASHTALVTGVSGKKIRVLSYTLNSPVSGGTVEFESSTSHVELLTLAMAQYTEYADASNSLVMPETAAGDNLEVTVAGASNDVRGTLRYVVH